MPAILFKLSRLGLPALCALTLCAASSRPAAAQVPAPGLALDPFNGLYLAFNGGEYYDPTTGYTYGPDLLHDYAANPGGSTIVSNDYNALTQYVNTDLSQTDHTYSTTLDALAPDGRSIFDMTFALPYSDPAVQAAVTQADALLAADGASPSAPGLTSTLLTSLGSQTKTVQTGESNDGTSESNGFVLGVLSSKTTFGPATVSPTNPVGVIDGTNIPIVGLSTFGDPNSVLYVLAGQTDVNVNDTLTTTIDQTVTTTTTDLLTQTYEITGTPRAANAVSEPGSLALLALGLLPVALAVRRRKMAP